MYTISDAADDYYGEVVAFLKNHNIFNEDVFQETALKCIRAFKDREIHKENVKRYFLTSYKFNFYAAKQHNNIVCLDELSEIALLNKKGFENTNKKGEDLVDCKRIGWYLRQKYGNEKVDLLKKHKCNGYSIRELEEESNCKNLRYTFIKMIEDARKHFSDN